MTLPSRWLVLRARFTDSGGSSLPDAGALLAQALTEVGGRAVQEEPGGWFLTHLPARENPGHAEGGDAPVDDDPLHLRALIAAHAGCAPGALEVQTSWQEHGDWEELWKRGLGPRRVTERLVVTPSWSTPDLRPDDLLIVVDPGMAFGNAEHGTTRGCLRLLDGRVRPGDRILDVGAGSAILSIAAALLGAGQVHAVEMDELAVPTARDNVAANGVAARVRVEEARLDSDGVAALGVHDGVVANIETGHLVPLLPGLRAATRVGGWLLLSGILEHEAARIRTLTEGDGFTLTGSDADGEWRSMIFERR